eukprot:CAMPEP_0119361150 /NCGR_PEP_ID=MMETSP1334-20130426/8537_1 /TAXON_ID=127549 /ORGANISM="Calcidiscus leptoporus, Strain RCC1130" /LENGTH=46 /DNA_ID= /DNA_START= /DNA_END= /DNA_ORIENTATION=
MLGMIKFTVKKVAVPGLIDSVAMSIAFFSIGHRLPLSAGRLSEAAR